MPKMLDDPTRDPDRGLLGYQQSGRFGTIVQYRRSFEHLGRFARSTDDRHAVVWRDWSRRAQHLNPAVGVRHETYRVHAREYAAIYQGMPEGFGLPGAGTPRSLAGASRVAQRLGVGESQLPTPT